jgi:hypothetical protein
VNDNTRYSLVIHAYFALVKTDANDVLSWLQASGTSNKLWWLSTARFISSYLTPCNNLFGQLYEILKTFQKQKLCKIFIVPLYIIGRKGKTFKGSDLKCQLLNMRLSRCNGRMHTGFW